MVPRGWQTAVHEAGHAVMAYLAGRRVRGLSAIARGDVLGEVQYRGFISFPADALEDARTRRKLEAEIMIALSGIVAEMTQTSRIDRAGAAADLQRALEVALQALSDAEEASAFVNWLFFRTRNRLAERRAARAVRLLATRLCRERTVSGADTQSLLRHSLRGVARDRR